MILTGQQVRELYEFMGGDFDTRVTIERCEARVANDGDPMPAGIYVWVTEYPEEGCMLLGEPE